jgi:hypothetical protein
MCRFKRSGFPIIVKKNHENSCKRDILVKSLADKAAKNMKRNIWERILLKVCRYTWNISAKSQYDKAKQIIS